MRPLLLMGIQLGSLVVLLTVGGLVLVWMKELKHKNLSRFGVLAALLTVGAGLYLARWSKAPLHINDVDLMALLLLVAVLAYIVFWAANILLLNRIYLHGSDGESSILSMMYLDSHPDQPDFPHTEMQDRPSVRPKK
jgi:hypothetical protein